MLYNSVARTLERLLDIQKELRATLRDLMMLGHDVAPNELDIFVGLPHRRLAHDSPEFVEVDRKNLPLDLVDFITEEESFADRFPDIVIKLLRKRRRPPEEATIGGGAARIQNLCASSQLGPAYSAARKSRSVRTEGSRPRRDGNTA